MKERILHISDTAVEALSLAQFDAIELGAEDCRFRLHRTHQDEVQNLLLDAQETSQLVCTEHDLAVLKDRHCRAHAPILINTPGKKDVALQEYIQRSGLRYSLGVQSPSVMRAAIGSILELEIGVGSRGLLPRLISPDFHVNFTFSLVSSTERREIIDGISQHAKSMLSKSRKALPPGSAHYGKAVAEIVDELLMNAIWDANPKYADNDRRSIVNLSPGEEVEVDLSFDGINLALCVTDRMGTFPLSALRKPFHFALGLRQQIAINDGPGGAGIGMFMILQKTPILTYEVKKDEYTRAAAIFRVLESYRESQNRPKTLLVYDEQMYEHPALTTEE